jgi:hypothetical protein
MLIDAAVRLQQLTRNRRQRLYRSAIFVRGWLGSVSPAVTFFWPGEVIDLLNRLPEDVIFGGMADDACADFIAQCWALPPIQMNRSRSENWPRPLSVSNLQLRWELLDRLTAEVDTREYAAQFRAWLSEELARLYADVKDQRELPVLFDLDPPFHVTQGGEVLCRRVVPWIDQVKPGQPLWVAGPSSDAEIGTDRPPRRR